MDVGIIIQAVLFILLALAVVVILFAGAKAIPRSHKIKVYRYSPHGDKWILGR